jgi:hypothetical protein
MPLLFRLEVSMPEGPMALTDEEKEEEQPEKLSDADADARPSEEFAKVALDTGSVVNSSHDVQHVLDDFDVPPEEEGAQEEEV